MNKKELKKIKTPEQMRVIEYFEPEVEGPWGYIIGSGILGLIIEGWLLGFATCGILTLAAAIGGYFLYKKSSVNGMTDVEYNELVLSKIKDSKARALAKIGLDEDEVKEIEPAEFGGYQLFRRKISEGELEGPTYIKAISDCSGKKKGCASKEEKPNWHYVSSHYVKTWLFFSNTQIYLWVFDFHLDKDSKTENTLEFFYKDITSLSTLDEVSKEEILIPPQGCFEKEGTIEKEELNLTNFRLIVPGDKFTVPMDNTPENNDRIQAMKQKLREKKQG